MTHPDHEKNRSAWNEMVDVHIKHPSYKYQEFLDVGYYEVHQGWVRDGDYWTPPDGRPRYPLMFSLKANKQIRL